MPKLFITGVTGYVGGDALYAIANKYPDLSITALVRNSDKGAKVAAQYPNIRLVYGDLDNIELLTTEASQADIVVHTANCDHEPSAKALVTGLAQKQGKPGYLLHTSGTGILGYYDYERNLVGVKDDRDKVYDDWDGIKEVTSLPDTAIHRTVDKIVLAAGAQYPGKIFTAIISPSVIWGPGRGPDNQKSIQVYGLAHAILKRGIGFHVGEGLNRWTEIHVHDVSNVYLALIAAALEGGGRATWNDDAYYFVENGEFVWGDLARAITKVAFDKKLINSPDIESLSEEEAGKLYPRLGLFVGWNSRCRAIRARKVLDWEPKQPSVFEYLPEIVDLEARDLGLTKSHAEKVAGGS